MGLDMYLHRGKAPDLSDEAWKADKEAWERSYSEWSDRQVAYWRKANHIHAWFVANVQDGKDDCGDYPVNLEQLAGLVQTCRKVLDDPSLAPKLLPTQAGFFFGDTSYSQDYYMDLRDTINQLEPLLTKEAIEQGDTEYTYHSSW